MTKKPDEGFGEEITFYINAVPFGPLHELKALDGMTWEDWINTEYNILTLTIDNKIVVYPPGLFSIKNNNGAPVKSSDIIITEYTYNVG